MLKKYFHVTAIENKELIEINGWLVSSKSQNGAFYGRAIYFWEKIQDAIDIGEYWYGAGKYAIIEQNIYLTNWKAIDKDESFPDPDITSQYFLSQNIRILFIEEAYYSHRRKILAKGALLSWLVNLKGQQEIFVPGHALERG